MENKMNQNWRFSGRQLFVIYFSILVCGMSFISGILWALYGQTSRARSGIWSALFFNAPFFYQDCNGRQTKIVGGYEDL
jgi:hypothetical protein